MGWIKFKIYDLFHIRIPYLHQNFSSNEFRQYYSKLIKYINKNDLTYISIGFTGRNEKPIVISLDDTHPAEAITQKIILLHKFNIPEYAFGWATPIVTADF